MADFHFTPPSRLWTNEQVAARLGRSKSWLQRNRRKLEATGFPQFDRQLRGTDCFAIERWLDERSGVATGHGVSNESLLQVRARAIANETE